MMCIDIKRVQPKAQRFKHEALAEAYYPEDYPHINKQLKPEEDDWKFENAKKEEFGMTEDRLGRKIAKAIDPSYSPWKLTSFWAKLKIILEMIIFQ